MNRPYKKEYSADGVLLNPITKDKPYLHGVKPKEKPKSRFRFWQPAFNQYFKDRIAARY